MSADRRVSSKRDQDRSCLLKSSKVVNAEMKNKIENTQLHSLMRILERERAHARFCVEKEKRHIVKTMSLMRETSGISERGEPPQGRFDRQLKDSPYFRTTSALSEKRFERWRTSDRQIRRLLRQQTNEWKSWNKEDKKPQEKTPLENVLQSLGYEDVVEQCQSERAQTAPSERRLARNNSASRTVKSLHRNTPDLYPKTPPLPSETGHSIRAWEKETLDAYIASVAKPMRIAGSVKKTSRTPSATKCVNGSDTSTPLAFSTRRYRKTHDTKTPGSNNRGMDEQNNIRINLKPPVIVLTDVTKDDQRGIARSIMQDDLEEVTLLKTHANDKMSRSFTRLSKTDSRKVSTDAAETKSNKDMTDENQTIAVQIAPYAQSPRDADKKMASLPQKHDNRAIRSQVSVISSETPVLSNVLPQWKRDLMAEAPIGLSSSTREPIKVALVMSKTQRRRELVKLVDDNVHDERTLVRNEQARRVDARLNVYGTMSMVKQAMDSIMARPWRP